MRVNSARLKVCCFGCDRTRIYDLAVATERLGYGLEF
jgi:hypothetical protein